MDALRHGLQIAATELRVEWRSRRVSATMLLLATLTVLVFAFAGGGAGAQRAVPAFWMGLSLAVAAGTVQWAARTHGSGVAAAWQAAGVARLASYAGLVAAMGTTLVVVALPLALITGALFDALAPARPGWLLLDLLLGLLAFAALATGLLPVLTQARARLGALLLLPLAAPILLAASVATRTDYAHPDGHGATLRLALVTALLLAVGAGLSRLEDRR